MARKLLRVLRDRLGDEAKGLRGVLSAEAIAAFIPPGGSDMVER
jgi:hypothetical protein